MEGASRRYLVGICDRATASRSRSDHVIGGLALGMAFENATVPLIMSPSARIQPIGDILHAFTLSAPVAAALRPLSRTFLSLLAGHP